MDKGKTQALPHENPEARTGQDSGEYSDNSVEMRISARPEWVRVARLATAGVAARLGFSYDDIEDLKLAVAEACNNAILHGGPENVEATSTPANTPAPAPLITIRWTTFPDRLQISVSDEGRMKSEALMPLPQSADGELREGGMGLLLIGSLVDKVEFQTGPDSNTTLVMTRFAPKVSAATRNAEKRAVSTPARAKQTRGSTKESASELESDAANSAASADARRLLSDVLYKP